MRLLFPCSRRSPDRASGFDRKSPDFSALINDGDNRITSFLRPKGQLPFVVRRVRSLPVGYHERTKFIISLFAPVPYFWLFLRVSIFVLAGLQSAQPACRVPCKNSFIECFNISMMLLC